MVEFILTIGLVVHFSVYLASRGVEHFKDGLAPFCGVRIPTSGRIILYCIVLAFCIAVSFHPSRWTEALLLVGIIAVVVFFPKRLPNHLPVAAFMLIALLMTRPLGISRGLMQLLTIEIFFFTGVHKLNRSFFNFHCSCGSGLVLHYCIQKGVVPPKHVVSAINYLATFGVVALELVLIPCLLLLHPLVGVWIAACLILMFGLMGHAHFAIIMFASLYGFVAIPTWPQGLLPELAGAAVLGVLLGNAEGFRYKVLAKLNYVILSLVAGTAFYAFSHGRVSQEIAWSAQTAPALVVIFTLFFGVNCSAPYLGLKWDGSLAMFSNLRPDSWDHLVVRVRAHLTPTLYVTEVSLNSSSIEAIFLFEKLFTDRNDSKFAIAYVADCAKFLQSYSSEKLTISCLSTGFSSEMLLIDAETWDLLPWGLRLCAFPFRLPPNQQPLCS